MNVPNNVRADILLKLNISVLLVDRFIISIMVFNIAIKPIKIDSTTLDFFRF